MVRQVLLCAFLTEAVPLFSLYSLLFASSGLSGARISALFVIWCVTGILAQVPTGALADRFSRRYCVAAAGLLQAGGYAIWTLFPHFAGFAAGFVGWGIGGSLFSGALEALLYDGLAAHGAQERYARVWGWEIATGLLAQAPAAGAATLLYHLGGFVLVGWVSAIGCLFGGLAALRIPEEPRGTEPTGTEPTNASLGYLATLRLGARDAIGLPPVRLAILAVAALVAFDGTEEYFPLLAGDWGVPTGWVPLAVVGIPLLAAGAAALSGARTSSGHARSPRCWWPRSPCSRWPGPCARQPDWPPSPSATGCTGWSRSWPARASRTGSTARGARPSPRSPGSAAT